MPLVEPRSAEPALLARAVEPPHPDIELGMKRARLTYAARIPSAGINRDTGLILYIGGYGMNAQDTFTTSLLSYLAERHNCGAATLDYFGARMRAGILDRIVPHFDFFKNLAAHYGLSVTAPKGIAMEEILARIATLLAQNGVSQLPNDCLLLNHSEEYNSMGFLPALDGLAVCHDLLETFGLNKTRLFLLGTSYGGYIAGLMAKLAPRTFRMVVDNSGFSSADDDQAALLGLQNLFINGVAMLCQNVRTWSPDPRSPNFFSSARRAIRDLLRPEHVFPGTARIYAYHSATDTVAPTARKLRLRGVYQDRVAYELAIVDASQIDGRLFKTLAHGMKASLRGLFDLSHEKFVRDGGALSDATDFDRESDYVFACGTEAYRLTFSPEYGVRAALCAA
ncbi:MAG TPA: DUF2920 family protein [Stellaceae bacterium]|jgi:pimeloyl-ACP methyl ester carboxylesterase